MKKEVIFIFSILILTAINTSCYSKVDTFESVIPDSLLFHLPKASFNYEVVYSGIHNVYYLSRMGTPQELASSHIIYIYESRSSDLLSRMNDYKKSAKLLVNSKDTNYLTISDELFLSKKYPLKNEIKNIYNGYQKPLILSFEPLSKIADLKKFNLYSPCTVSGLPPSWTICVLKSGFDFVLDKKLKFDLNTLPIEIQHGYSSGVAFDEVNMSSLVIYWAVVW